MATRIEMKLLNRWAGLVAVLVFSLSACGVDGVATLEPVDGVSAPPEVAQSQQELRKHWDWNHRFPGMGVDAGTPPFIDAGTPAPILDAGTPPPIIDAGTPPIIDAGTPPPVSVDAGAPPVIDAGTPVVTDAGSLIAPGNPGPGDVTFAVNTTQAVHPISRYIYGKNFNGSTWAQEPNLTMNRLGGNRWTAYNWENNASNAGSDYNYQNDSYLGGGNIPGEAVRLNVANARAAGGATLVTVPILGWVAADKLGTSVLNQPITSRFSSSVPTKGSAFAYPPNLTDTVVNQDEFVAWLESTFPTAHQDPARELFYSLDNEPDLWADTHSEIHPAALTYAELLSKSIAFSSAIKTVAPQAKVLGFVSYGYYGFTSLQGASDAAGRDFTDFFLDGMRSASTTQGQRLIDVLDLHWYPEAQGGGVRIAGEDTSSAVAAARVQAPRSLWDPGYVETSWITSSNGNQPLRLIPSMKEKIAAHYPGTGLSFSEYYYGGGSHISGGIAQADVLGIFGREGAHSAALWATSSSIPYITAGFAMFRSYDGVGGSFGDVSVQATNSDTVNSSVYASVDSSNPGRVVLVLINKATTAKVASLTVTHTVAFGHVEVYQLTSATPNATRGTDVVLTEPNALRYTMPASSVSTLVFKP
jgi:predicted small lipoprotein YifL